MLERGLVPVWRRCWPYVASERVENSRTRQRHVRLVLWDRKSGGAGDHPEEGAPVTVGRARYCSGRFLFAFAPCLGVDLRYRPSTASQTIASSVPLDVFWHCRANGSSTTRACHVSVSLYRYSLSKNTKSVSNIRIVVFHTASELWYFIQRYLACLISKNCFETKLRQ